MSIKITQWDGTTMNGIKWGENVTHEVEFSGDLWGEGVLHFYPDPLVAELFHCAHGYTGNDVIAWECTTGDYIVTDGVNWGTNRITTIREVELPLLTIDNRVDIAIVAAMKYGKPSPEWIDWANKWMSYEDRSWKAAIKAQALAKWGEAALAAARAAQWATTLLEDREALEASREAVQALVWAQWEAPLDVLIDLASIIKEATGKEET